MSNAQELMDARRARIVSTATAVDAWGIRPAEPAPKTDYSFIATDDMKWRAMILANGRPPALAVAPEDSEGDLILSVHISSENAFLSQIPGANHSLEVGSASIIYHPISEPGLEQLMAAFDAAKAKYYGADA